MQLWLQSRLPGTRKTCSTDVDSQQVQKPRTLLTPEPSCKDGRAQVTYDRIGQQGTPTRLWAGRGSRPAAPRDCRYAWAYLFGAVCPARGVAVGLVLPFANTEMFDGRRPSSLHLAEISKTVAPNAHALLTIDGAGWHQTGDKLCVPDNIMLLHLPPYSPS